MTTTLFMSSENLIYMQTQKLHTVSVDSHYVRLTYTYQTVSDFVPVTLISLLF